MYCNLNFSPKDIENFDRETLRQKLRELFLIYEVIEKPITKENFKHYKHSGVKPGQTHIHQKLRSFSSVSDFKKLYEKRLSSGKKIPFINESDFISDELFIMNKILTNVLEKDFNNEYKGILRGYINFLSNKNEKGIELKKNEDINNNSNYSSSFNNYIIKKEIGEKIVNYLKEKCHGKKPAVVASYLYAFSELCLINGFDPGSDAKNKTAYFNSLKGFLGITFTQEGFKKAYMHIYQDKSIDADSYKSIMAQKKEEISRDLKLNFS